ncbi:MAG: tRNA (N6-isopentenyl adenosine(37)-C2)-methylthiotransferase MiaB [Proteobacteria bacterium]|nr:tRNA (N6-isopentenyl adenosine(37)-C2)-methylthiotransferase MiaB [Pseudomonadota bacterium]
MAQKLHIKTYGCQMNVYDSGRMADVLAPLGYRLVDEPEAADMIILNTCHIREKAAEKVYSELGRLRLLKTGRERQGGRLIIAVAGCVAQAENKEILRRAPFVDMVFGPQSYHRLPEMVARLDRGSGAVLNTDFPPEPKFDHLPAAVSDAAAVGAGTAFLTVQEGCDKFCTFCVVPYTRGAEYSRPAADVEAEARRLVAAGAREITLLGQNVNNYSGPAPRSPRSGTASATDGAPWGLGRLIAELAGIDGLDRIRYTTSYPADMDDELITAHREVRELMPFLHLPVQSGCDRILKAMNRRHTADDYRRLAGRLREARPDIGLSSDFIVGFPGETDADFDDTLKLVRDIGLVQAYSFKYSPRPGTPAALMEDHVPDEVKVRRLAELQALLNAQKRAFNSDCVGRVMPVLLDRRGRQPGQLVGRSPYMQAVHMDAPDDRLGTIQPIRITAAHANSLTGCPAAADGTGAAAGGGIEADMEGVSP